MKRLRSSPLRLVPILFFSAATATSAFLHAATGSAVSKTKVVCTKTVSTTLHLRRHRCTHAVAHPSGDSRHDTRFSVPAAMTVQRMASSLAAAGGDAMVATNQSDKKENPASATAEGAADAPAISNLLPLIQSPYAAASRLKLCPKCHGEGRISKPISKKARLRHQRKLYQQEQEAKRENEGPTDNENHKRAKRSTSPPAAIATASENPGTKQNQPLPLPKRRWDPCPKCDQTGLLLDAFPGKQIPLKNDPPFVAIVGGGIGGMALAVALKHRNIPFRVFEKDSRFDQRRQGYGLTLQQARRALRALGIFEPNDGDDDGEEPRGNFVSQSGRLLEEHAVTSTKHVVHTPDGKPIGEWGLRKWVGGGAAGKDGRECSRGNPGGSGPRDNAALGTDTNAAIKPRATRAKNKKRRQNLHVPRQVLRSALWESLKEAFGGGSGGTETATTTDGCRQAGQDDCNISWGHKLVDIEPAALAEPKSSANTNRVRLTFRVEGSGGDEDKDKDEEQRLVTTEADLVVGCDGIRSSVRKRFLENAAGDGGGSMPPTPLRYLECVVVLGICPLGDLVPRAVGREKDPTELSPLLDGETVFQTADGTTRIYLMPYSKKKNEYMWQLSFPVPDERTALDLSRRGPEALREEALRRCGSWHSPIPEILSATPIELVSGYPVYDRDLLSEDLLAAFRKKRSLSGSCSLPCTLLGDAAHPMSPFKGQGANQALLDALSLARSLQKVHLLRGRPLGEALEAFEGEMVDRSSEKVRASSAAARFLHTDVAIAEGNLTRGAAAAFASGKSSR